MIDFTIYTNNSQAAPIVKEFKIINGELVKHPAGNIWDGIQQHTQCNNITEFTEKLTEISKNSLKCIGFGLFKKPKSKITWNGSPDDKSGAALPRTKHVMSYPDGEAIFAIDIDGSYVFESDADNIINIITETIPELKNAPMVITPSSSGLVVVNGVQQKGGLHIFIHIMNGKDIERFAGIFYKKLWLNGHGFMKTTSDYAVVERAKYMDKAIYQVNRILYVGKPIVGEGISLVEKPFKLFNTDAQPFDTSIISNISRKDQTIYEYMVKTAKNEKEQEIYPEKKSYVDSLPIEAKKQFENREHCRNNGGELLPNHEVILTDNRFSPNTVVTVSEILSNKKFFHGVLCCDPLTPEKGRQTGIIYSDQPKPLIHSFDNGETNYNMKKNNIKKGEKTMNNENTEIEIEVEETSEVFKFETVKNVGKIRTTTTQLRTYLMKVSGYDDDFPFDICFDTFTQQAGFFEKNKPNDFIPLTDSNYHDIKDWFNMHNWSDVPIHIYRDVIFSVAEKKKINTLEKWVKELKWDGHSRMADFTKALRLEQTNYTLAAANYLFSSLAGKAVDPQVEVQSMVVLVSRKQGVGKTIALQTLAPTIDGNTTYRNVTLDNFLDPTTRARLLRGATIVNIDEMASFHKKESESLKSAISLPMESFRELYRSQYTTYYRQCSITGTSNNPELFNDTTGNRRYYPLEIIGDVLIDLDWIKTNMEQLWAEGLILFRKNGVMFQEVAKLALEIIENYMDYTQTYDPWEEIISKQIHAQLTTMNDPKYFYATIPYILENMLNIDPSRFDKMSSNRVGRILKQLGFKNKNIRIKGVQTKAWVLDEQQPTPTSHLEYSNSTVVSLSDKKDFKPNLKKTSLNKEKIMRILGKPEKKVENKVEAKNEIDDDGSSVILSDIEPVIASVTESKSDKIKRLNKKISLIS